MPSLPVQTTADGSFSSRKMDISSSPASRFHSRLSESHLWALTQLLDYGWMLGIGFVVGMLFGGDQTVRHSTLSLAAACDMHLRSYQEHIHAYLPRNKEWIKRHLYAHLRQEAAS